MRSFRSLVALCALSLLIPLGRARACGPQDDLPAYGTTVRWQADAAAARAVADAEGKLLFVLHLSGELGEPDKT